MEFEKENDIMDQRQEMMDDAIDDVTGLEDEEEGEEVVKEVLDEIGIDLGQSVGRSCSTHIALLLFNPMNPPLETKNSTNHNSLSSSAWRNPIRPAKDCRGRR